VRAAQRAQQPTISVDTKKKELVGDFKNAGRTWRPAQSPQQGGQLQSCAGIMPLGDSITLGVQDTRNY